MKPVILTYAVHYQKINEPNLTYDHNKGLNVLKINGREYSSVSYTKESKRSQSVETRSIQPEEDYTIKDLMILLMTKTLTYTEQDD